VLTPSLDDLKAALDRHTHSSGITASEYARALTGLPQNALLTLYGNLSGLLATQKADRGRDWPSLLRARPAPRADPSVRV
jgi:hypothetical protein